MARRIDNYFRTTIQADYDVRGWKHFPEAFQEAYNNMFARYREYMQDEVDKVVGPGKGPGPHPHRFLLPQKSRTDDISDERYNFVWEDTGNLAGSIQYDVSQQGYRRTWRVFTDEMYGAFLEIGFHPIIPVTRLFPDGSKTLVMERRPIFYRYPWLSTAVAATHQRIVRDIRKEFGKTMLNPKFNLVGTEQGMMRNRSASGRFAKDSYRQEISDDIASSGRAIKPLQDYMRRYGVLGHAAWFPDVPKERPKDLRQMGGQKNPVRRGRR